MLPATISYSKSLKSFSNSANNIVTPLKYTFIQNVLYPTSLQNTNNPAILFRQLEASCSGRQRFRQARDFQQVMDDRTRADNKDIPKPHGGF